MSRASKTGASASIHSAFTYDEEKMAARVLKAVRHPHVHVLGHMTGLPAVDTRSVGAGGGSIARVDAAVLGRGQERPARARRTSRLK